MYHVYKRLRARLVTIAVDFETSSLPSKKNLYFCIKSITKMKKCLILFVLLSAALQTALAQTSRLYTSELGLPNSQINRICQDGRGFLWVCTEGGLLRYDGVFFEEFRHDQDNDLSLLSDSVHDFCEDGNGVKWVGTASGLAVFDSEHSRFDRFDLQDSRQPESRQFIGKLVLVPKRTGGSLLFVVMISGSTAAP